MVVEEEEEVFLFHKKIQGLILAGRNILLRTILLLITTAPGPCRPRPHEQVLITGSLVKLPSINRGSGGG